MREIKFKAYVPSIGICPVAAIDFHMKSVSVYDPNGWHLHKFPLDSVKLMEYTGLKDKNGEAIYEDYLFLDSHSKEVGAVVWDDKEAGFAIRFPDGSIWPFIIDPPNSDQYGECVGNIYEQQGYSA